MITRFPQPATAASPLNTLPEGTVNLARFASLAGVPQSEIMKHTQRGIDGERLCVTKVVWQDRLCRYVTPGQQRDAMAFWKRHRVPHHPLKVEAKP